MVEKGEIAHFPQCFPKSFFFSVLNSENMEERVKDRESFGAC